MGVEYELINITKKEKITFMHLPCGKEREIVGNPVSAAISSWYLLKHSGDEIGFIPDQGNLPFNTIKIEDTYMYKDVTEEVINELIDNQIIKDYGLIYIDEDDPEIYIRDLRNIWMED